MEMPRSQDYCGTVQTIFGRLGRRSTLLEFNRHGTGVIRWSSKQRTCALLTLVSSRILNHQEGYPSPDSDFCLLEITRSHSVHFLL
jgi:hypothetical protein